MGKAGIAFIFLLCCACRVGHNVESDTSKKKLSAYLFVYFTGVGENQEAVRYGVSPDGYHFYTINNNQPILDSKEISSEEGVRDPHVLRSEDGKTFYMACTDMMADKGWDSNRGMVLLKSSDLINWTSHVVNIQNTFSGNENLKRVWAPQTIYDAKVGRYMVYFSMKHGDEPDKIYFAYVDKEFTGLETVPKQLFYPKNGKACIDGDIILKDDTYYLFYKSETEKPGIMVATSKELTSGKWNELPGYVQQTNEDVEGSGVFKLNNSNEYILMYDIYRKGQYQFTKSTSLEHFTAIDKDVAMDFHPRHGTILPISRNELQAIFAKWGKPQNYPTTKHE